MTERGLYVLSERFFQDFPDPCLMQNKGGRPFYYCVQDKHGLFWMIPLSSKVEKYRSIVEREEAKHGKGGCVLCHVGPMFGAERAFCISNIFPVTSQYVEREFIAKGVHYVVSNDKLVKDVRSKALRYLKLVELGKLKPMVDISGIQEKLLEQK